MKIREQKRPALIRQDQHGLIVDDLTEITLREVRHEINRLLVPVSL